MADSRQNQTAAATADLTPQNDYVQNPTILNRYQNSFGDHRENNE